MQFAPKENNFKFQTFTINVIIRELLLESNVIYFYLFFMRNNLLFDDNDLCK